MVAFAPEIILAATIDWCMSAVAFLAGMLIGRGATMKVFTLLFSGAVIALALGSGRYRPLVVSVSGADPTVVVGEGGRPSVHLHDGNGVDFHTRFSNLRSYYIHRRLDCSVHPVGSKVVFCE